MKTKFKKLGSDDNYFPKNMFRQQLGSKNSVIGSDDNYVQKVRFWQQLLSKYKVPTTIKFKKLGY